MKKKTRDDPQGNNKTDYEFLYLQENKKYKKNLNGRTDKPMIIMRVKENKHYSRSFTKIK